MRDKSEKKKDKISEQTLKVHSPKSVEIPPTIDVVVQTGGDKKYTPMTLFTV